MFFEIEHTFSSTQAEVDDTLDFELLATCFSEPFEIILTINQH
jgi:hypothetical protein